MRNRKYGTVIIDGVDYWENFKFPFVVQKTLDESLDFAVVELHGMTRKEPFKPFTQAIIGEGDTAMSFVVSYDEVTEVFGTGLYKHEVTVIEKTKETERIMCGAKAFTNPLVRDYSDGKTPAYLVAYNLHNGGTFGTVFRASELSTPTVTGKLVIPLGDFLHGMDGGIMDGDEAVITIYRGDTTPLIYGTKTDSNGNIVKDGTFTFDESKYYDSGVFGIDDTAEFDLSKKGVYIITCEFGSYSAFRGLMAEILVSDKPVEKPPYTIETVVNHLLDTAETLRDGLNVPRYRLRYTADQQRKFKQNAPEFRFSNGRSLWENLHEVGQFIHAIPRAVRDGDTNYIEFDDLGCTEYADISKGDRYGGGASLSVGDYTAGLESMATNLINMDDETEGSMAEPFMGGWVSLRASTEDARIKEGTGIIKTAYPIAKLVKVEVGQFTVGGKTYSGGDITPYVFSKPEYDVLSNFSGEYPTSKTYAIYYTPDSPNIEGLWFKAQDSGSSILDAFESYSITNVITAVTGAPTGVLRGLDYVNLVFRVTYIPAVIAKVRQFNPLHDGDFPAVLAHNQSANKLSARAFGENLRGQLAMMGKADETAMYRFPRLEDLPKVGALYDDDRYISSITARVYHDFVLARLNLSAGYNQLGARVEINNAIRQFEIPSAEDRYTTLEEFVVIGKKDYSMSHLTMTSKLRSEIVCAFGSQTTGNDIDLAEVTTKDDDGETLATVVLPVISLSIGTSLYFGWRFESNFSAGSKSAEGGTGFRYQEHISYGDPFYSHAETVGFRLLSGAKNAMPIVGSAHMLPETNGASGWKVMADTLGYPILWHKDSADAGCLAYQVHYMTNDGMIVGDGASYFCSAVRTSANAGAAKIYYFSHRINQLTGTTNTADATESFDVVTDTLAEKISFSGTPFKAFKSWAIIKGGRFMLGKNTTEAPENIYFNFKRRINK